MVNKRAFMMFIVLLLFVSSAVKVFAEEIVVYSAREKSLTKRPFKSFSVKSGINIKLVTGRIDELLERLKKEGENSPADILITVDAGSLWEAAKADLLQPIDSDILNKNIPPHLRDPKIIGLGCRSVHELLFTAQKGSNPRNFPPMQALQNPNGKIDFVLEHQRKYITSRL